MERLTLEEIWGFMLGGGAITDAPHESSDRVDDELFGFFIRTLAFEGANRGEVQQRRVVPRLVVIRLEFFRFLVVLLYLLHLLLVQLLALVEGSVRHSQCFVCTSVPCVLARLPLSGSSCPYVDTSLR